MGSACIKMTLLVFIAVLAMSLRARSQAQHSFGENERCVCHQHVTINPPVCGRSVPVNSSTGCNKTTVQEILLEDTRRKVDELQVAVSVSRESVSSELEDTSRKVDDLQVAVSGNHESVSSELEETRRKVDELQVAVSGNHESVSSELQDMKRQLEMLQSAVTSIVGLLKGPEWHLVFQGVAGTGIKLYDLWTNPTWDSGSEDHGNYRNESLYNAWNNAQLNIKQVKLSLYDHTGVKAELVFNGEDSDTLSWFAKERIVSSPWSDLTTTVTTNYFSIDGDVISGQHNERRFFINRIYGGCGVDRGWLVVVDLEGGCQWEQTFSSYPVILYSPHNIAVKWDTSNGHTLGTADYLTIHIITE